MVLKPDATQTAREIFDKWDLDFMPIDGVTETGRLVLLKDGGTACDIPLDSLVDDAPEYDRPQAKFVPHPVVESSAITSDAPISSVLLQLLETVDLASRHGFYEQYDSQVVADTLQGPGGDAGLIRVHGSQRGLGVDELHTALCRGRPTRWCTGGSRGLSQHLRRWRTPAGDHQQSEFWQPREAGNHDADSAVSGGNG